MRKAQKLKDALRVLADLGMPKAQSNERTALCLLALVNMTPTKRWRDAEAPLIGITPIMDWASESEVWIANAPSHMIHFNGSRFLGPY